MAEGMNSNVLAFTLREISIHTWFRSLLTLGSTEHSQSDVWDINALLHLSLEPHSQPRGSKNN